MRPLALAVYLSAALAACGVSRQDGRAQADGPASRAGAGPADAVADAGAPDGTIADAGTFDEPRDEEQARSECAQWCTEIAVCWEQVNDKEYNHGGICSVDCRDKPEAERRAFGRCVTASAEDCPAMLEC